jgi:acyl-CoA synthetase (AMP-forming)/AMP-acid ligase II
MLYDCWQRVARDRAGQFALSELATGRHWTFGELAAAAQSPRPCHHKLAFPHGASGEFVLEVLRAWRDGQVVCPIDPGHSPPRISGKLPAGTVHLKTTSASTGAPRLVVFTAAQLMADAENIVATMGLQPDWPNLGVISLAHSYGFSNLVLPLLLHGIPLILVGAALPEAVRRAAANGRAVTLAAVPALWRTWHETNTIPENVRLAVSAGAPLPLALEQEVFERSGLKIHNFYGSSECGGIAYDASAEPRSDAACVGAPMRNVRVTVAADGCLEVRGRAVGASYWPEPSPRLENGVFHTNDLGVIAAGLVHLRGRAGDQINVAGRKLAPELVERVLSAHPQVRQCLAFGVPSPDAQRGEIIVACVAASQVTGESLKQFAMSRLPAWQVPREWWLVDSLPANGRGKLSRAEWRKRYLGLAQAKTTT